MDPPDIDDSIVLSDVVASGEASRLRRRHAMRIEPTMRRPTITEELPPGSEPGTSRRPYSYSRFLDGHLYDEDDALLPDCQYSLSCGVARTTRRAKQVEPLVQSLLPLDSTTDASPSSPIYMDYEAPTGCGRTLLLSHVQPSYDDNVWLAQSTSSSTLEDDVVVLDRKYYDSLADYGDNVKDWAQEVTYSCGCIEGGIVACRHCGNLLGTQRVCCPPHRVCALRGRGRHRPRAESRKVVYTLLASGVTSSPRHSFPPTSGITPQFLQPRYRPMLYASPEPLMSSIHLPLSPPPLPPQQPPDGLVTPPNRTISLSDVLASLPSVNPDSIPWLPRRSSEADESQRPVSSDTNTHQDPVTSTRSVTPFPVVTTPRSEASDITDSSQTPMRFAVPAEIIDLIRSRPRTPPTERTAATGIHLSDSEDMFAMSAVPLHHYPGDSSRRLTSEARTQSGVSGRAYTPFDLDAFERTLVMAEARLALTVPPNPTERTPGPVATPQPAPPPPLDGNSSLSSKRSTREFSTREGIHITAAR